MNREQNKEGKDSSSKGRQRNNDSVDMMSIKPQPLCLNPLAKAMEKKTKVEKAVKSRSSETWYEERIESQSQIRYQETQTDLQKRKKELLRQLKEAEAEVETMKDLLEQRDKMLKDSQEEADNQITSSVENMDMASNIDQVQKAEPNQGESAPKQKSEKFTKKKIQGMKEKLLKMNQETESYLADIENTMQYLESLEVASDRMGPVSEETRRYFGDIENEEDVIAKVYEENVGPNKENVSNQQEEPAHSDDETPAETDEFQNDNMKQPEKSQFFITRKDMRKNSSLEDE